MQSSVVTLSSYTQFSRRFNESVHKQRIAAIGAIEVTRRCPLECVHCYNNVPMGDPAARGGELTYKEHCRILDEITGAGCLYLLYTGGEIFVRRDFLDIYTYAKRKGLLITLFTNGTLISPKIADYLVEWRPFAIEITLYGYTRETYERLTGIPGSYDRCMKGMRLLLERRLPLKLKTVALTINRHEVWDMKRFAEQELDVEFKFDSLMNPRIDCSQSPLAVRLRPEEIVEFDLLDPKRAAEWKQFAEKHGGASAPEEQARVYHCGGGISAWAIDPEGKLSICALSHAEKFDLRKSSFREGWEVFLKEVREKEITRLTKCTQCRIQAMCGMCAANGELESGHPEAPVDFLCHVAHLRAYTLDIPVPAHGPCEYCEGGSRHDDLRESLDRLRALQAGGGGWNRAPDQSEIPARNLAGPCATSGFMTCGSQSVQPDSSCTVPLASFIL
jgi:radical SAM protein with 4Fe4S-binding SPASM domain